MTDDRRYDEDDIARIFELATREEGSSGRAGPEAGAPDPGLTLAEIQQIGAEVGILPERIAESARALAVAASPVSVRRKVLGFPLSVGGATPLPRPLTEEEWDRLVSEIRTQFNSHGKLERAGTLRSWRNGNLRIQLEPSDGGQQIQMQTHRRQSEVFVRVGGVMIGVGAGLGTVSVLTGTLDPDLGVVALMGAGFLAAGLAPLRTWARRRREQMESIAASAVRMATRALTGPGDAGPSGQS